MVAAAESWGIERTLNFAIIALRGRARTEARMAMADDELETWSDLCDLGHMLFFLCFSSLFFTKPTRARGKKNKMSKEKKKRTGSVFQTT